MKDKEFVYLIEAIDNIAKFAKRQQTSCYSKFRDSKKKAKFLWV